MNLSPQELEPTRNLSPQELEPTWNLCWGEHHSSCHGEVLAVLDTRVPCAWLQGAWLSLGEGLERRLAPGLQKEEKRRPKNLLLLADSPASSSCPPPFLARPAPHTRCVEHSVRSRAVQPHKPAGFFQGGKQHACCSPPTVFVVTVVV